MEKINRNEIIKRLDNIYDFDELYKHGVRVGDIVAHESNVFDCGLAWEYVLLRDGFPDEYNTALCSYKDPRYTEDMYPSMIGFRWYGSIPDYKFRKISDEEKKMFVDTWVETLYEPIIKDFGWQAEHYAQILNALIEYKLISEYKGRKINKELKKIHDIDLMKKYSYFFNFK